MTDYQTGICPDLSQDELVSAAASGDGIAISRLWEQNRRWIAAVILAHKPRGVDLEDLLQEVAMTLVNRVDTLREGGNLRAWLRVVAVNAARASARKRKYRRAQSLDGTMMEHSVDPGLVSLNGHASRMSDDEETERIMNAIRELPETYREPLMMRAVHGMSSRQIGETLEISEATVDTRVARARRMLRDQMEQAAPDRAEW